MAACEPSTSVAREARAVLDEPALAAPVPGQAGDVRAVRVPAGGDRRQAHGRQRRERRGARRVRAARARSAPRWWAPGRPPSARSSSGGPRPSTTTRTSLTSRVQRSTRRPAYLRSCACARAAAEPGGDEHEQVAGERDQRDAGGDDAGQHDEQRRRRRPVPLAVRGLDDPRCAIQPRGGAEQPRRWRGSAYGDLVARRQLADDGAGDAASTIRACRRSAARRPRSRRRPPGCRPRRGRRRTRSARRAGSRRGHRASRLRAGAARPARRRRRARRPGRARWRHPWAEGSDPCRASRHDALRRAAGHPRRRRRARPG